MTTRRLPATDGARQADRPPAELADGYFKVDGMRLEELITLAEELSSNLHYYNLNGRPDGTWSRLWTRDVAYVMADILSVDPARLEAEFRDAGDVDGPALQAVYNGLIADRIRYWQRMLSSLEGPSAMTLREAISHIAESELSSHLQRVQSRLEGVQGRLRTRDAPKHAEISDQEWFAVWRGDDEDAGTVSRGPDRGELSKLPDIGDADSLESEFYAFLSTISHLQTLSAAEFPKSLESRDHSPPVGLAIAFLRLFAKARTKLNEFPHRRLQFYYDKVLGITPRPSRPDGAHLKLFPVAGVTEIVIPEGTEFSGALDDGERVVVFATDNELRLTDASVESLRSLYLEKSELISPERDHRFVTQILTSERSRAAFEAADAPAWPLVAVGTHPEAREAVRNASIGFAVASPLLFLREGERTIRLRLRLTARSEGSGRTEAAKVCPKCPTNSRSSASRVVECFLRHDQRAEFFRLFRHAFTVQFSGRDGWNQVTDYVLKPVEEKPASRGGFTCKLEFEIILGRELGPVLPYSAEVHGPGFETSLPLLRFRVNPQASFCPYSFFDLLDLESVNLETEVEGATDLLAYNDTGQLDPSKPFHPFGPLPSQTSYLVLGSYEAARKALDKATLHVEWADLPRGAGGFREHYRGYDEALVAKDFEVDISALTDGHWQPNKAADRPTQPIFERSKEGGLEEHVHLTVPVLDYLKPLDFSVDEDDFRFDQKPRNGFIRLSLAPCPRGFGHEEYPRLLTEALTGNLRRRRRKLPLPKEPYTPRISRIWLDYAAESDIPLAWERSSPGDMYREKLFHEHPWGIQEVNRVGDQSLTTLYPRYREDGYLFLGLSATQITDPLTLLFEMHHDPAVATPAGSRPTVTWYYLASNRLEKLPEESVLADTTEGFLTSGIVTLQVPAEVNRENTILPSELFWLAAGVTAASETAAGESGDIESFARLYAVRAGAVRVTWQASEVARPDLEEGVPAGTLVDPVQSIPGLGTVEQIGSSFGGRLEEDSTRRVTRVSERLRHKQRASLPWDYERLVLERFSELFKVKCLPGTFRYEKEARVLVVVVPHLPSPSPTDNLAPVLSSARLDQIRNFVGGLTSDCVRVEVCNPVYEEVQVRCAVKLSEGAQRGHSIQRMNDAIVDFLSPWTDDGYQAAFDWKIRREDVEARLREFPFVESVTAFSMLKVTEAARTSFRLGDTALAPAWPRGYPGRLPIPSQRVEFVKGFSMLKMLSEMARTSFRPGGTALPAPRPSGPELTARYPWSLAVPSRRHEIRPISEPDSKPARITGYGELEIGANLILDDEVSA